MNPRETGLLLILAAAATLAACHSQTQREPPKDGGPSVDTVKILSVTPDVRTALHAGESVSFSVDVQYSLVTAQSGSVALVIQRGEKEYAPLANETSVIQKGSGTLHLEKEITVPETTAILVYTPLTIQGATRTRVRDSRAYTVVSR